METVRIRMLGGGGAGEPVSTQLAVYDLGGCLGGVGGVQRLKRNKLVQRGTGTISRIVYFRA